MGLSVENKKRVLAIVSIPQECGTHTIDFISLEDGKVIDFVNIDGFYSSRCISYERVAVGDCLTLYTTNIIGKLSDVDGKEKTPLMGGTYYLNAKCTKEYNYQPKRCRNGVENDNLYIVGGGFVKKIPDPKYAKADKDTRDFMATYVNKYIVAKTKEVRNYNIEEDEFYQSFYKRFGIELKWDDRIKMDVEKDLVPMTADIFGFEVVNVLRY